MTAKNFAPHRAGTRYTATWISALSRFPASVPTPNPALFPRRQEEKPVIIPGSWDVETAKVGEPSEVRFAICRSKCTLGCFIAAVTRVTGRVIRVTDIEPTSQ